MDRAIYDRDRTTVYEESRWIQTVRVHCADSPISVSETRIRWGQVAADLAIPAGIVAALILAVVHWAL